MIVPRLTLKMKLKFKKRVIMEKRRVDFYNRIIEKSSSAEPIVILSSLLLEMEKLTSDYRELTKNLESLIKQTKTNQTKNNYGK